MSAKLHGVLPIVQMPFLKDELIDFETLKREVDWGFSQGIDGLGTGMVSETLKLTASERTEVAAKLVEFAAARGPVFIAVGAESTRQAVEFARGAQRAGASAVMATPPIGGRVNESQMFGYFCALADAVDVPVIVQDASGYVGQAIPMAVYRDLLSRYGAEKILFKPEASPVGPNLSALREATEGRAQIFEGSGGIFLIDSFRRGIAGTMPGMEVVDCVVALWSALRTGDEDRSYQLSLLVGALVALQLQAGLDGFLAIEKHLLVRRGVFSSVRRRQPYAWELDTETEAEVERLFGQLQGVVQRKKDEGRSTKD